MERRKRQAILLGRHPIGKDDVLPSIEPALTQRSGLYKGPLLQSMLIKDTDACT